MNTPPRIHRPEAVDERLETFRAWLDSIDRLDWRAGLEATRKLRSLGISVCLAAPPRDRRPA